MRREQLEDYHRRGRLVRSAIYLRKARAEEHMSLEDTLARHKTALLAYACLLYTSVPCDFAGPPLPA